MVSAKNLKNKRRRIYFDHAAATPVDPSVQATMAPYFSEIFGNASSVHWSGRQALQAVDQARAMVARFLRCQPHEIIFTAGGTESDNIVIQGLARPGEHIITSKIEHPAILESCGAVAKRGVAITSLDVDRNGLINIAGLKQAIKKNTRLISIMYVNNEIGTIQPIAEIGRLVKAVNSQRKKENLPLIYFHTDAVQAALYCPISVVALGVDLLSLSAHKIYGPKGIGVLYCRNNTPIMPIQFGGSHEFSLRPGSLNVPGIVGLGRAIELLLNKKKVTAEAKRIKKLRDELIAGVRYCIPRAKINGDLKKRVVANAHFSFAGVDSENLLLLLDQAGIDASAGSACAAGSLQSSHVLAALGQNQLAPTGNLRITLGKFNTQEEVRYFLTALVGVIKKLNKY
ncbi:MAG: hypothetical protein A2744_02105 [Candidatus Buchananbacteria bacterium RIFCSPHIGHO2_01_FULL_44_11]|uniref:cysteine desulfurase n=1 Tax=Candidatus Buchananbacteria bacterium RIFCSPHIGHO2_01_FULL_44_11 TaxID=1797535 RepID=A0A1G1XZK4_9BACT|nr:MAG: hypothetical protein A2744_02105 [Candidatus Buchananbacteria bacterium RIFCSPHIGHO2_01_FULL_44_11]